MIDSRNYLIDKVISSIEENKAKREQGLYINIPFPFPRFRSYIPGIQKSRYYLVSASPKVGKTQITDYMFMLYPYFFLRKYQTNIKLKVFYFSLEISALSKIRNILSFFLYMYSQGTIRLSPENIDSQFLDRILSNSNLEEIKKLRDEVARFENSIEIIDNIRNPYGIFKYLEEYALDNGKLGKKEVKFREDDGTEVVKKAYDWYEPNDPEEYRIVIIDHYSLLSPENKHHNDLGECIREFSKDYALKLRDRYGFTVVPIQQQAGSQESTENVKLGMLQPSPAGLADCKYTARDCDMMLTLFSPARYKIPLYEKFDIKTLGDNFRELGVSLNRHGNSNIYTPLYFQGDVNHFQELPPADSSDMRLVYEQIRAGQFNISPRVI